ncbi:MAG: hypothetical protein IPP17_20655 [Bacteroidetes bacterium]|nr:hypothetical protein [Bacteroidota bacterium]
MAVAKRRKKSAPQLQQVAALLRPLHLQVLQRAQAQMQVATPLAKAAKALRKSAALAKLLLQKRNNRIPSIPQKPSLLGFCISQSHQKLEKTSQISPEELKRHIFKCKFPFGRLMNFS